MSEKDIKGAKGDAAKERRLVAALRANLTKRKAQARTRKSADEREGG